MHRCSSTTFPIKFVIRHDEWMRGDAESILSLFLAALSVARKLTVEDVKLFRHIDLDFAFVHTLS